MIGLWLCTSVSFAMRICQDTDRPVDAAAGGENGENIADSDGIPSNLTGEARRQAAILVRQLGSPDFGLRQQASRELWKIGPPAIELLDGAVDGGVNSEARMRAKDLATLIKVGVKHDANAEVVECITGFLDREEIVQDRSISKLCHLQQVEVALKLIELVDSESDRTRLRGLCSMAASDAELALRLGEYDKFQEWINNPATRESQKLLYYYHLWRENKLEPEIERLQAEAKIEIDSAAKYKAKLDQEKTKRKSSKRKKSRSTVEAAPKQPKLKVLIGLLRFIERWDEAIDWADKVFDRQERRTLTHSILMESGNWKQLADLIVELESDDVEDENDDQKNGLAYKAEGYRKALVLYYAGDEEKYEAALRKIEEGIAKEAKKQRQRGNTPPKGNLTHANFLRYALDFDRAVKYSPLKKDLSTFQLLSIHRQYKKLFEVFKLDTFERRERFFRGRSRHIRSLQKRVEYYAEQKDSNQLEVYVEKRDTEIQNWLNVVGLLATLGFDEEAELYYRQMFFEFSGNDSTVAFKAVNGLKVMGAFESAWEIAEIEAGRNSSFDCRSALLNVPGYQHEAALFLDTKLKKDIDDPIERCRKIASLIKSPTDLSNIEIDFWQEISGIDFTQQSDAIRYLFMIWGLDEETLFKRAASLDEVEMLEQLMKDGEYLLAAQKFEAFALASSSPLYYAKAWYAYRKSENMAKAKQMRLLFVLNFNPDDVYDYTSGYNGTHWQALPFDAYRLHDCLEYSKVGENSYYMWRIAADDKEAVLSAHQKMVRTQILRLRYIESPYFDQSESDHPRFIEGCLESGDVAAARRWFKKLSSFQPADSGFVEENFPSFTKIASKEFVDEMFQGISDDFYDILKSFPDSAMYLNNYAWACACAKRNVANGIELSKRAVELRPGTPGYLDTLAELYHVNGQNELAIETIKRAIEINPMRDYYVEQLKKFKEADSRSESQ